MRRSSRIPKVARAAAAGVVLLVRHASAEESHALGDDARGLDAEGRRSFRKHARFLARQARISGIATSPLVRAVQTAEILAEAAGLDEVVVLAELLPNPGAERRIVEIAEHLGPCWALVGHNPSLAEAVGIALGLGGREPRIKKGGAIALQRRGNAFALAWAAFPGRRLVTSIEAL